MTIVELVVVLLGAGGVCIVDVVVVDSASGISDIVSCVATNLDRPVAAKVTPNVRL